MTALDFCLTVAACTFGVLIGFWIIGHFNDPEEQDG